MADPTQNDSKTIGIDGTIPLPPRRRWLRRITLILLLLITLAAGIRVWWGHFANQRVAAFLTEAKTRGEPSSPADLQSPPIPQDKNGAILVAQASHQFHLSEAQYRFLQKNSLWLDVPFRQQPGWQKILGKKRKQSDNLCSRLLPPSRPLRPWC